MTEVDTLSDFYQIIPNYTSWKIFCSTEYRLVENFPNFTNKFGKRHAARNAEAYFITLSNIFYGTFLRKFLMIFSG